MRYSYADIESEIKAILQITGNSLNARNRRAEAHKRLAQKMGLSRSGVAYHVRRYHQTHQLPMPKNRTQDEYDQFLQAWHTMVFGQSEAAARRALKVVIDYRETHPERFNQPSTQNPNRNFKD